MLIYRENRKHKRGVQGGPPRWNPDPDSLCPDDVTSAEASNLLGDSVPGKDDSRPDRKARYAMDSQGRMYKGYCEGADAAGEYWHGFPVPEERIRLEVPARVLRRFMMDGKISQARYRKLLGSGR